MSALQILPRYNFEDWQNWEGKWELIHGIPYAMSPAPVPKHQIIANALGTEFGIALKTCKNCKAMQPIDYKIGNDIIVQPDLLVVCKPVIKPYLDFPPTLVAEILSPATALKDRHTKYQLYQEQNIKYYVIISLDTEEAEIFENAEQNFKLVQKGKAISYQFVFTDEYSAQINFGELWK